MGAHMKKAWLVIFVLFQLVTASSSSLSAADADGRSAKGGKRDETGGVTGGMTGETGGVTGGYGPLATAEVFKVNQAVQCTSAKLSETRFQNLLALAKSLLQARLQARDGKRLRTHFEIEGNGVMSVNRAWLRNSPERLCYELVSEVIRAGSKGTSLSNKNKNQLVDFIMKREGSSGDAAASAAKINPHF